MAVTHALLIQTHYGCVTYSKPHTFEQTADTLTSHPQRHCQGFATSKAGQALTSARGRMTLLRHREYGGFRTVPVPASAASLDDVERPAGYDDAMVTVWEDGRLLRDWTFAEIRAHADAARL